MLFRVTSRRISHRCIQNPGRESSRGGGSGAAWPGLALSGILAKRLLSSTPSVGPIKPDIERLKSQPPKIIPDYLTPMPSHLLTTVLADLEACGSGADKPTVSSPTATLMPGETLSENRSGSSPLVQSPPATLPQGHHLVYFPIQTAPSHLAADGADMDHSPGSAFSRRLWAGGEVSFRGTDSRADRGRLAMDGQAWTCTETIGDVRCTGPPTGGKQGDEKVFVDVWRRYALGHTFSQDEELPWSIEERRTLVFVKPGEEASVSSASASPKIIKCEYQAFTRLSGIGLDRPNMHLTDLCRQTPTKQRTAFGYCRPPSTCFISLR